jgi:hypothetical protein
LSYTAKSYKKKRHATPIAYPFCESWTTMSLVAALRE